MTATFDSSEERELLGAVKKATELVDGGQTPDAASEKLARDSSYGPGRIRLIASTYNTGKQLSQFQANQNVLDKLTSYPLADAQSIIDRIYGADTVKAASAIHADYAHPPRWLPKEREKTASALDQFKLPAVEPYKPDPMFALQRVYGQAERDKKTCEELRRQEWAAKEDVRRNVALLSTYFRKAASDRLPFAAVENAANTYFGPLAAPLMDLVYNTANLAPRREKRSDDADLVDRAINVEAAPFDLIRAAIKSAEMCTKTQKIRAKAEEEAEKRKDASVALRLILSGFRPPPPLTLRAATIPALWLA